MSGTPRQPTILEDWRRRREALAALGDARPAVANVQLAILDAVLARFGAWPESARPAAFALPGRAFRERTQLLAEHGLARYAATVRTEKQAHERMSRVLGRMAAVPAEAAEEAPAEAEFAPLPKDVRRANRWRQALAGSPTTRLEAIRYLGEAGDLDDVGLLLDLLSLPCQADEVPAEREAIIWALRRMANLLGPRPSVAPR
jgi:hypothetical protein